VWRRIGIVSAGPIANFLLAIVFYWVLFLHGLPALKPMIGEPPAGTPAAHAGLVAGDEIRRVNGIDTPSFHDLRLTLLRAGVAGDVLTLELADGRSVRLEALPMDTENLERDTLRPLGIVRYDPQIEPIIGELLPDGAAVRAGFQPGDRLIAANGQTVANWQDWVKLVRQHPSKPLRIEYERQGQRGELTVTPDAVDEAGQRVGKIGAGPRVDDAVLATLMTEVRYGPLDALWQGAAKTWDMSLFTLEMMGRMVLGQVSWKNLSGPLTIADYAGQSATLGWISFVGFLALVSVSLGVLNLLPIPLLDGGHLMYYVAEVLIGRPVSERTMEIGARIGMALLLLLMSFALFNDLQRLIGG
jgi:regulator of sigma E protease